METNHKPVSIEQVTKMLTLMSQKGLGANQLQALIESGLLSELFGSRELPTRAREKVRVALGRIPSFQFMRMITLTNNVGEIQSKLEDRYSGYAYSKANNLVKDLSTVLSRIEALAVSKATLVFPTVAELGLPDGTLYADACKRGKKLGFKLCPPEIGIQLALQDDSFADWSCEGRVYVMMTPLTEDGYRRHYSVSYSGDTPILECFSIAWGNVEHKGSPLRAEQRCAFLLNTQ